MTKIDQAMIMAAGLGTRMLPLTKTIPKPMVKIMGKSFIEHIIYKLKNHGINKVIINIHYLADILMNHIRSLDITKGMEIIFSYEEELLNSAGGIVKALPFFENKPFYRFNSDIFWIDGDIPLIKILEDNWDEDLSALLLMITKKKYIGYEKNGDFSLMPDNNLKLEAHPTHIFASAGIFSCKMFENLEEKNFTLFEDLIYKSFIDEDNVFKNIKGIEYDNIIFSIDNVDNLEKAKKLLEVS